MTPNEPIAEADTTWNAPATAWLFDVDGVLTDPERKTVREPALFDELMRRLRVGEPIGLNTGRSLDFVLAEVLVPLEQRLPDTRLLRRLFPIGEKGGVWVTYAADGVRAAEVDGRIPLPRALQDEVRALLRRPDFAELMFYDETKQTMISTELRAGKTVTEYAAPQRRLVAELAQLLARHHLDADFKIDPSRIATDVEHRGVGKARGAARFVAMLAARGIQPRRYVCFGDSASDYDMLVELARLGHRAELIFVGEPEHLRGKDLRSVTFVRPFFDQGTLRYLQEH